jgi:F0F1-type ATP synthase membrane subunit b/b'
LAKQKAGEHMAVEAKDDLDQLLEAERRLAGRLEEARASATQLLEVARADAQAFKQRAEEDERNGRTRIAGETQAELEAELERVETRANQRVETYAGLTGDQLRELSLNVLRALLEDAPAVRR